MLITRCPHCATAFKVVPDQLRLGQGWVKCGRCRQAFEAQQHFVQPRQLQHVDIDTAPNNQSPHTDTPAALDAAPAAPPEPEADSSHQPNEQTSSDDHDEDDADAQHSSSPHEGPQTLLPVDALDEVDEADAGNAIDELVALGAAMRPAGVIVASDASSPADMYATTLPVRSGFMDSYVVGDSRLSTSSTLSQDKDAALPTGASASSSFHDDTDTDTGIPYKQEPPSSLEQWRKNKANVKFKPPRTKLKKIQIADQELTDLQEQINKPPFAASTRASSTAVLGATKPWHPQDAQAVAEEAEPSFVADSLSRERWQRWPVRLGLVALLAAGAVTAAAQLAYLNRQYLAAAMPDIAPALVQLCEPVLAYTALPCDVLPLKRIEAMRVDSHTLASELSTEAGNSAIYVMNITLKNQADLPNAWPALEIAFTDISGSLQSRRVLQSREYLPANISDAVLAQGIKARDEQRIAVRFEAPSLRVGGYEITVFYP
jgi:predicted Zn finger-like uncharacterized protein